MDLTERQGQEKIYTSSEIRFWRPRSISREAEIKKTMTSGPTIQKYKDGRGASKRVARVAYHRRPLGDLDDVGREVSHALSSSFVHQRK
ncbi:hypothetical protein M3J09_002313 [Ascochyta lentis]